MDMQSIFLDSNSENQVFKCIACNFTSYHLPSICRHQINIHNIRRRRPNKIKTENSDITATTEKPQKKRKADPRDVVHELIEYSTALFFEGEDVLSSNKHKKIANKLKNMVDDVKREVKPPAVFDER